MAETGDESVLNRVPTDEEDWNRCGRRLGRERWRRTATRDYDRNTAADKVFRQTGQAIVLAPSPTKFDRYIFAFDIAGFIQSLAERGQIGHVALGRPDAEIPDHRHRLLLRARNERPCRCRAAKHGDELAAVHSITSSASESMLSGILTPRAFAVLRLMTNSNLVGCSTGKSPGFSPLRMRPT